MVTSLFLAVSASGLLVQLLYALLVLAVIGCVLWAIDRWIWPIPSPVRGIIAIVLVLCLVIYILQRNGL